MNNELHFINNKNEINDNKNEIFENNENSSILILRQLPTQNNSIDDKFNQNKVNNDMSNDDFLKFNDLLNPEAKLDAIINLLNKYERLWHYAPHEFVIQHLYHPEERFPRKEWYYLFVELKLFDLEEWISLVHFHALKKQVIQEYRSTNNKSVNNDSISSNIEFLEKKDLIKIVEGRLLQIEDHEKLKFTMNDLKDSIIQFLDLLDDIKSLQLELPISNSLVDIPKAIKNGMKMKKVHEIERLAGVICNNVQENNISDIVDIGAGQGYLTQTVSALLDNRDLTIIALDNNDNQIEGSNVRVRKISEKNQNSGTTRIKHITCHLSQNGQEFEKYVHGALSSENPRSLLMGLHCCGDLSVTCLNIFSKDEKVSSIVNIGCCYHKITEPFGFPLSNHLKEKRFMRDNTETSFRFTSGGLGLACISPQLWTPSNSIIQFRQHSFRCALELFLKNREITKCNYVGHVRKTQTSSFSDYAFWAIPKMKEKAIQDGNQNSAEKLENLFNEKNLQEELKKFYEKLNPDPETQVIQSVLIFWSLRALISPLIESTILLDRYIYLNEQKNVKIKMFRIFDETLSPRNTVIIGKRINNSNLI